MDTRSVCHHHQGQANIPVTLLVRDVLSQHVLHGSVHQLYHGALSGWYGVVLYWYLVSPAKPVGSGLVLLPSQNLVQVRACRFVWITDQPLSKSVTTYWYCCLLHWSGLPGQFPQQPAGGFWTVHQHSGAFFLVSAQSRNRTGLTTQATWPSDSRVL